MTVHHVFFVLISVSHTVETSLSSHTLAVWRLHTWAAGLANKPNSQISRFYNVSLPLYSILHICIISSESLSTDLSSYIQHLLSHKLDEWLLHVNDKCRRSFKTSQHKLINRPCAAIQIVSIQKSIRYFGGTGFTLLTSESIIIFFFLWNQFANDCTKSFKKESDYIFYSLPRAKESTINTILISFL